MGARDQSKRLSAPSKTPRARTPTSVRPSVRPSVHPATIFALNVTNATLGASAVVAQPDARSLYLANLNFVEVFAGSLASFQDIMSFTCSNCMLHEVPSAIFELRELRECRLHNNQLQKLPTQFEDSQIEILDVAQNKFASVPDTVWRMRKLRTLDLSSNQVASCVDPLAAQGLNASLASLVLDQNPIAEFACMLRTIPSLVFRMDKLRRVVLSGNAQLQLDAQQDRVSLSINELHLASCELTSVPMQLVKALPALRTLNLSWNKIASLEVPPAPVPLTLQMLDLTGNQLGNVSAVADFIAAAPALKELRLASNRFSSCNLSSPQSALEILNLSSNALKSCQLALPKLRILDLRDNKLQAVPPFALLLPSLDELYLTGNPIGPWTLTEDQREFLGNLSRFVIQQSAFASCPIGDQQSLHGYKVCVTPLTLPPLAAGAPPGAPNNATDDGTRSGLKPARSDKFQVLYILASFLLALVIGVVVYRVMMKKSTNKPATVASSPGSVAFLESPPRFSDDVFVFPSAAYASVEPEDDAVADASSSQSIQSESLLNPAHPHTSFTSNFRAPGSDSVCVDDELAAWRVDYDSVQLEACLSSASGAFVEVWEATYRLDKVAVKKLKPRRQLHYQQHATVADPVIRCKFLREVKVLSRLDHPRIVAFYGVAWANASPILCVMEYMPQHDLHSVLQRQRGHEAVITAAATATASSTRSSASTQALQEWGVENAATIRKKVAKGELRPTFSPTCPPEVLAIADLCLAVDPRARPRSLELTELLRRAAAQLLWQRTTQESLKPQRFSRADSNLSLGSAISSVETDWSRRTLELKPDWKL
ncbi:hypothetical protein PybrP1_012976 [[Pythium] brassicae (nom. inval.)]|nr:hypothetical protein PybrP1_012976 [[Pythium] brassicae (nom. inval.)]